MDASGQKLQAFVAVVESGSFTQAAARLSYSQSGVSRMIADLEREWGVVLLERERSGVRPTSDGLTLLPHAQRVCETYRELHAHIDNLRGLESGLIRIGTFSSVATHWLPGLIEAFRAEHPCIEYELLLGDYGEIEQWIRQGRVDCGFSRLPVPPDLEARELARDELLAVVPEGHRLARLDRIPLSALCDEPFLLLEKDANTVVSDVFRERGYTPNVQFTTWDDYAIMAMVEGGMGVSVLPELILRRVPYRIVIRPLDVPAHRTVGLVVRRFASVPLAAQRFIQQVERIGGEIFRSRALCL